MSSLSIEGWSWFRHRLLTAFSPFGLQSGWEWDCMWDGTMCLKNGWHHPGEILDLRDMGDVLKECGIRGRKCDPPLNLILSLITPVSKTRFKSSGRNSHYFLLHRPPAQFRTKNSSFHCTSQSNHPFIPKPLVSHENMRTPRFFG